MSEINCFGTEESYGEVFPGWYLVRLVNKVGQTPYEVNGFEMKEGDWGLTSSNDPSFVFGMNPMADPDWGLIDEEIDAKYSPENVFEPREYFDTMHHYMERLEGNVYDGYLLVKAVIESGWDEKEGGLACYILHKMWEFLEACDWKPIRVYEYE